MARDRGAHSPDRWQGSKVLVSVDIVRSVMASDARDLLAGTPWMHDVVVVARPIPEPPYEVIAVRTPNSLHPPPPGLVRIEHLAVTHRNDVVDRPPQDAIPLFWRFIWEKYGIASGYQGSQSGK